MEDFRSLWIEQEAQQAKEWNFVKEDRALESAVIVDERRRRMETFMKTTSTAKKLGEIEENIMIFEDSKYFLCEYIELEITLRRTFRC